MASPDRVSPTSNAATSTPSPSLLRAYVEALGGLLKVTAEFDDSTYLVA
jgi:hypothetical protein